MEYSKIYKLAKNPTTTAMIPDSFCAANQSQLHRSWLQMYQQGPKLNLT